MGIEAETRTIFKVSVRDLVAFTRRSGDLSYRVFVGATALEGIRGHQRVQRARPEGYRPEVPVSYQHAGDGVILEISGRVDGVYEDREPLIVEEIKTTRRDLDEIPRASRETHLAQAMMYGFILGKERSLRTVAVQLTYLQLDSGKKSETRIELRFDLLYAFFLELIAEYLHWARRLHRWRMMRDASLRELSFPFAEYRRGQRRFAAEVYRAIKAERGLFAQAPTGIGKTLGALFPALKAMPDTKVDKLFFLTAKTMGARAAALALNILREKGTRVKALHLTAKDKMCFQAACDPEQCEYAKGYYDRLGDALKTLFEQDDFHMENIRAAGESYQLCPFELSLDLAAWMDVIICDYNYVFDPSVFLRRFFGEPRQENLLLVDEAHNLVGRARAMYSAELEKRAVLGWKRMIKPRSSLLARKLAGVNRKMLDLVKGMERKGHQAKIEHEVPQKLITALASFCRETDSWLAENPPGELPRPFLEGYFEMRRFVRTSEYFNPAFAAIYRRRGRNLRVKLFCLDPSRFIEERLARCSAYVFFSATLTPFEYFTRLLGAKSGEHSLRLPSPFPPRNLCPMVAHHLSTRYRDREKSRDEVCRVIQAVVTARRGNYLVYLPSYRYLADVFQAFGALCPGLSTLVQEQSMDDSQRDAFLERFQSESKETLVGFAVMGGSFGEGIDLVGERLIGVIVVGVGLPQVNQEQDLIRDYFQERGAPGFAFAYQYPGMNRVLQTAGRVIRSARDRGVVCLLDERFAETRYRLLFPAEWQPRYVGDATSVARELREFWAGDKEGDAG